MFHTYLHQITFLFPLSSPLIFLIKEIKSEIIPTILAESWVLVPVRSMYQYENYYHHADGGRRGLERKLLVTSSRSFLVVDG